MSLKSFSSYSKCTITDQFFFFTMKFMVQLARNQIVRVCFDVKYGTVPYITVRVTVTVTVTVTFSLLIYLTCIVIKMV